MVDMFSGLRSVNLLGYTCAIAHVFSYALQGSESTDPLSHLAMGVRPVQATGVHNLFALGTNIFSGSAPEGDEGFASLEKIGIKTIITVDGSKPDVETAHKYGMRYVHLPHGYDGIDTKTQAALAKAAQILPGPVFVHCHHGMHRGPAAAAVICMADYGWTHEQANAWLKGAGTATNYLGLFETIMTFQPPTPEGLRKTPSEFPETVKAGDMVDMMVAVDERWDRLKAVRKAGYETPKDQPDIQPAHEAVILGESYREAQRLPEASKKGEYFLLQLKDAEQSAKEIEQLLNSYARQRRPETGIELDAAFDVLAHKCAACHKSYRDPSFIKSKR